MTQPIVIVTKPVDAGSRHQLQFAYDLLKKNGYDPSFKRYKHKVCIIRSATPSDPPAIISGGCQNNGDK